LVLHGQSDRIEHRSKRTAAVRLAEEKIKEAILHPDLEIRDRATDYFARAKSPDPSIMPLIIRSVETYGRQGAYRVISSGRDLRQTEDTIAWIVRELNDPAADQFENHAYNLSMVLAEADPGLLLPLESAILEARHLSPEARTAITERLRMLSWDAATCWQRLEEFCETNKDKNFADVDLDHAYRIADALARFGPECENRVRDILSQQIDSYDGNPMIWMEPAAVRLAGRARLESTIPLLVARLNADDDILPDASAKALIRIGTPAVLEAIAAKFPGNDDHIHLAAIEPLEGIHSDLTVEKCLQLLGTKVDLGTRQHLADALLGQFASEGVEIARQLLLGRKLDFESRGLRNRLLETCTLSGERFPEYDEWLAAEKAEKEEHWRRMAELKDDPHGQILYALEKLTGKKAPALPPVRPPTPPLPRLGPPPAAAAKQKVGRNDRCPCGSGKKYKNCCMR
jgi:hypothetical protein